MVHQYSHSTCKHRNSTHDTVSIAYDCARLTSERQRLQGHGSWLGRGSRHTAATLERAQWADPSHLPACVPPLSFQGKNGFHACDD